jgi:hypothetical protein
MNRDPFIHPSEKKSVLRDQYKKWRNGVCSPSLVTIWVQWRLRIHGRHRRPRLLAVGGAPRHWWTRQCAVPGQLSRHAAAGRLTGHSVWLVILGFFASPLVALPCCLVGLGAGVWCAIVLGLVADSASTHSYKQDRYTRMKYPWVIRFGLLLPKLILVYPMGGYFVPYPYPWGQFLSHTCTLIGEFPTG